MSLDHRTCRLLRLNNNVTSSTAVNAMVAIAAARSSSISFPKTKNKPSPASLEVVSVGNMNPTLTNRRRWKWFPLNRKLSAQEGRLAARKKQYCRTPVRLHRPAKLHKYRAFSRSLLEKMLLSRLQELVPTSSLTEACSTSLCTAATNFLTLGLVNALRCWTSA